jgi:antitoxin component YwqK of YwqJK toxin-antitoxin module
MRRIIPVLIIGLLCNGALSGAQTTPGTAKADLNGAVKAVRYEVSEFASKGGKRVEGRRMPLQTVTYDANGNKVEQLEYNPDGSVARKLVYTYDARGRANGYEDHAAGSSAPRRHIYVFDEKGKRIEYRIVQPDGAAGEKYLYKYDVRGALIEESLHDHKGALISRNVYAYDDRDRQVSQTRYNADGSLSSIISVSYDAGGKPIVRTRFEGDTLTYRVRYVYDSKGRVLEQETAGSVVESDVPASELHAPGRVVYVYKGKEQPREANAYNPDGSVREKVVIEYDARGNWIKKTRLIKLNGSGKSEPQRVEYRTITYWRWRTDDVFTGCITASQLVEAAGLRRVENISRPDANVWQLPATLRHLV